MAALWASSSPRPAAGMQEGVMTDSKYDVVDPELETLYAEVAGPVYLTPEAEVYDRGFEEGAREERAQIAAWLRLKGADDLCELLKAGDHAVVEDREY